MTQQSVLIQPHLIYEKLLKICKNMRYGKQEDAFEFLLHLIESMSESCTKFNEPPDGTNPMDEMFAISLVQTMQCSRCGSKSEIRETKKDLMLDIKDTHVILAKHQPDQSK